MKNAYALLIFKKHRGVCSLDYNYEKRIQKNALLKSSNNGGDFRWFSSILQMDCNILLIFRLKFIRPSKTDTLYIIKEQS